MGTVAEIQAAITRLSPEDKTVLSTWLESQIEPAMTSEEEAELLHRLDQAAGELDAGKGVSISDARGLVSKWLHDNFCSPSD